MQHSIFTNENLNGGFNQFSDFVGKIKLSTGEFTQEQINDLYYSAKQQCSLAGEIFDTDPELALNMIVDSINSLPEVTPLFFYKLSHYLKKLKLYGQAYRVIEIVQSSNDFDDIGMYNMYKSIDIEKYSSILYANGKFSEYIHYYFRWYHNRILAFTFQGRRDALLGMIKEDDKLSLWATTRINFCFKTLNIKGLIPEYNYEMHNFTNEIEHLLLPTCNDIHKLGQKSSMNSGLSVGSYVNSLIKKNSVIFDIYNVLNNSYDEIYYQKNVARIFS